MSSAPDTPKWFAFVESNTTDSGRAFCAAAKARGLRAIMLTVDPTRYRYLAEDGVQYQVLDTGDEAAVLGACRGLAGSGLAGVTSSSEYFIAMAAEVAARLGLPGPDPVAVRVCRAKDRQRDLLAAAGVAVPRYRVITRDGQPAVAAARELGFPVVVKPATGSGSVGVRLCVNGREVSVAVSDLLTRTADERGTPITPVVLVEEYVRGAEFSVETLDDVVIGVTGKHLGPPPFFVETGHDFPAPVPDSVRDALASTALAALAALGLGWGANHTELRLGANGPMVIEVNPRLAGGMIPAVVAAATGIDLVDACLARAVGASFPLVDHRHRAAAIRFLVARGPGELAAIHGLSQACRLPGVLMARTSVAPGTVLPELTRSFRDRLGYVIASGANTAQAAMRAETALCALVPEFTVDGLAAARSTRRLPR